MRTRPSFVDRIKALFRLFRNDKHVALNEAASHQIEVLPASASVRKRNGRFAIARAMASGNQVGALAMSAKSDRVCSANVKSVKDDAQTPSDLG